MKIHRTEQHDTHKRTLKSRLPWLTSLMLLVGITWAQANVWPIEDTWSAVGPTTLSDITGTYDNGDGANETMLLVDGTTSGVGQGVTFDFRGVLSSGEALTVDVALVNPNDTYCSVVIDFYNTTDNTVISSSPNIVLAANSTQSVQLSMTAASGDNNDLLQLRIIRVDDGAYYRDFAVDSVLLDDWYFPRTSNNSKTPDLPLLANDAALQADMDGIINSWYAARIPNPSSSQINSAESSYNSKNIVNNNGDVAGDITSWKEMTYLQTLAGALVNSNPSNSTWLAMVNNTVKVAAQNLLRGTLAKDGTMYDVEEFARDAVLLKDYLDQGAKDSLNYVLYRHTANYRDFWKANYPGPVTDDCISTDEIYNLSDSLMLFGIGFQKNQQEAQRWARGFKRYCDRFATPSRGTSNGIKVDGSGFHHWANYDNYMYAYSTFVAVLEALDNTQMQIDVDKYYDFRDAMIAQIVRSRKRVFALTLCGRNPEVKTITVGEINFKQFAQVGGRILGFGTADPEVAKVYNATFGLDPSLGTSAQNNLEGAFQHNYAHMGIFRNNNWTATMRGFSSYMWGTEAYTYAPANRYGRYQSYGALQVIYEGGAAANGIDISGWDWNYAPGATSIVLPFDLLHAYRARIDELQEETFAGFGTLQNKGSALLGDVHGTYGVFGMKFHERENQGFSTVFGPNTHNNTFKFRKSYFAFDDIIIALGSNISNDDSSHNTVTTLYQREANDTQAITVNGASYTSQGVNTFGSGSSRWALDRLNTGYYIPASNDDLVLSRVSQTTPPHTLTDPSSTGSYQSGVFAKLYIDHGSAPNNDDYEYVVIPDATATQMSDFESSMAGSAASRPYQVMAKDVQHHVVKYQGNGKEIWGMALFDNVDALPAGSIIKRNVGASLVLYERLSSSTIKLSVTDPDLGLTSRSYVPAVASQVVLTLAGNWTKQSVNDNIAVWFNAGSNETTLTIDLLDGMPEEVDLFDPLGNNAPVFTSNPVVEAGGFMDAAYSSTLADDASDGDSDPLIFLKLSGPAWLNVATNGLLSGTPGAGDVGLNSWNVQVSDGTDTNTATLEIVVNPAGGGSNSGTFSNNSTVPISSSGAPVITSDINISSLGGLITDVNVEFDISHTYDSDLIITLIAPDLTEILLVSNRGGGGDILMEGMEFGKDSRNLNDLIGQLVSLKEAADSSSSEFIVNILPDDSALHGRIVQVMDACAAAKVKNMSFSTASM